MIRADYIVVGSGLTGATIARTLADAGREVVVLERREHLGGNVYDKVHEPSGIRYHVYGPHYFRTNSDRIWEWVQRFSPLYKFEAKVATYVGGRFRRWPLTRSDRVLYWDEAVNGYNRKMWGDEVPDEALQRIEMRQDDNDWRLKTDKHQGLPENGYAGMMQSMLKGIEVEYTEYQRERCWRAKRKVIYTGPIDELYGYEYGKLGYRGQKRKTVWYFGDKKNNFDADVCQVNFPDKVLWSFCSPFGGGIARALLWHNMQKVKPSTALVGFECPYTPDNPNDYEYPVNVARNRALYQKYRTRADADGKILVCGRLGEYKYMDMDQAIGRALVLAERLLKE